MSTIVNEQEQHLTEPDSVADTDTGETAEVARPRRRRRAVTIGLLVALVSLLVGSTTYFALGVHGQTQENDLRAQYVETARRGALNLVNVSFQTVDDDVARLLSDASGAFQKDFGGNAESYKAVVKQAQVTSTGEILADGIESADDSTATVLVAVHAEVKNLSTSDGEDRSYRLRVSVSNDGDRMTVSDVQFVA